MLDTIPRYLFNAKEKDEESGMYYYEARYYAPPTFISRDPLFEKYFWMSPYNYCGNNPVIYIDPTGEEWDIDGIQYQPGQDCPEDAEQKTKDKWNTMNKIYTTDNGKKVIDEMNKEGVVYKVSSESSPNGTSKESGKYVSNKDGSGGTIYLYGNDKDMDNLSHEMFHGYQDLHGQGSASIHNEVEAYLFEASVQMQYNKSATARSILYGGNRAYNAIVSNMLNNYTDKNMNLLIDLFKTCSGIGVRGSSYDNYPSRVEGQNTLIKNFYPLKTTP
jgi:RHS repeat-associated protein